MDNETVILMFSMDHAIERKSITDKERRACGDEEYGNGWIKYAPCIKALSDDGRVLDVSKAFNRDAKGDITAYEEEYPDAKVVAGVSELRIVEIMGVAVNQNRYAEWGYDLN